MAVAPLPNVRAVLDYAVTELPAEKLLLGVPNYGYDWPLPFVQGQTGPNPFPTSRPLILPCNTALPFNMTKRPSRPIFTIPPRTVSSTRSGSRTPAAFPPSSGSLPNTVFPAAESGISCARFLRYGACRQSVRHRLASVFHSVSHCHRPERQTFRGIFLFSRSILTK